MDAGLALDVLRGSQWGGDDGNGGAKRGTGIPTDIFYTRFIFRRFRKETNLRCRRNSSACPGWMRLRLGSRGRPVLPASCSRHAASLHEGESREGTKSGDDTTVNSGLIFLIYIPIIFGSHNHTSFTCDVSLRTQ